LLVQVSELVGVHDPVDLPDLVAADVEGQQCELAAEPEGGRGLSVHVEPAHVANGQTAAERSDVPDHVVGAQHRLPGGVGAAAAVAVGRDVGGQQVLHLSEVTVLQSGEEALERLVVHGASGAPDIAVEVATGPTKVLAGTSLRDPEDVGDLGVGHVEGFVQHEHRALRRCQRFHHAQRRQRHGVASLDGVQRAER
jgi:hypothetical protein